VPLHSLEGSSYNQDYPVPYQMQSDNTYHECPCHVNSALALTEFCNGVAEGNNADILQDFSAISAT
jgi:hypothetical protein